MTEWWSFHKYSHVSRGYQMFESIGVGTLLAARRGDRGGGSTQLHLRARNLQYIGFGGCVPGVETSAWTSRHCKYPSWQEYR